MRPVIRSARLSFGSGLALELYRWHPTIPRTLILASAYAGWAGSLPPDVVEQRKRQMLRLVELPPEQFAREFIPTLLTDLAPAELVDEVTAILSDFHPAGQRALIRAGFAEHDVRDAGYLFLTKDPIFMGQNPLEPNPNFRLLTGYFIAHGQCRQWERVFRLGSQASDLNEDSPAGAMRAPGASPLKRRLPCEGNTVMHGSMRGGW